MVISTRAQQTQVLLLAAIFFSRRFFARIRKHQRRDAGPELSDDKLANTRVVIQAAKNIGVETRLLPGGYLELKKDGRVSYSYGSDFMLENIVSTKICGDKYLTSFLLREAGIPVPDCRTFSPLEFDKALSFFASANAKLVVKPRRSTSGGAGVTTELSGKKDFLRAFALAASFGKEILVEEFVPGDNYRFLIFKGEVLSVIFRDRLHVIGDGIKTLDQLVDSALCYNIGRPRPPRSRVLDDDAQHFLRSNGLSLSSIPGRGDQVYLKQMCNSGPISELQSGDVPAKLKDCAVAAARVTGASFCAVDIISAGDAGSGQAGRFCVNEVNTSPALFNNKEPGSDGTPDTSCTEIVLSSLF